MSWIYWGLLPRSAAPQPSNIGGCLSWLVHVYRVCCLTPGSAGSDWRLASAHLLVISTSGASLYRGKYPVRGCPKKLQDALFKSLYVMCIVDRLYITQQTTPDTLTGHMLTGAILSVFACALDVTGERCEHL